MGFRGRVATQIRTCALSATADCLSFSFLRECDATNLLALWVFSAALWPRRVGLARPLRIQIERKYGFVDASCNQSPLAEKHFNAWGRVLVVGHRV